MPTLFTKTDGQGRPEKVHFKTFQKYLNLLGGFLKLKLCWIIIFLLEIAIGTFYSLQPMETFLFVLWLFLSFVLFKDSQKCLYCLLVLASLAVTFLGIHFYTNWSNDTTTIPFFIPILLVVLVIKTMTGLFTKDNTVNQTVFVPLLMIFLLWASFSILLMDNKYHGLITFIVLAANACAFLVTVYSIKSEVMLRQYMWFWVLYAAFIGIATILNLYFNYSVIDFKYQILDDVLLKLVFSSNTNKAFSIGFANYTGIFINFSIAITSGMLMTEKKQYRSIFLLGILLLLVFTLLATGSKGGLLGLLSMSGFLLISFRRFRSKFISASIIIFLTMVISMGVISVTNKANTKGYRLGITALSKTGTGSSTNRTSSLGSRINIWRDGFSEFKRSFGIGLGAGGFTHYCEPHPHSHNYYLSILFDYGLIGLLLFAGVILAWVRLLLSLWKHQDTFLQIMVIFLSSGLVGLGVQSLVDFSYTMALSWLYFGVVIAACLLARKEFFMESKHAH